MNSNPMQISVSQFFKFLKDDKLSSGVQSYELTEPINIDSSNYDFEERVINSVLFREPIKFEDMDLRKNLIFVECEFSNGVSFDKVIFGLAPNNRHGSLFFSCCTGSQVKLDNRCVTYSALIFEEGCDFEVISIGNSEFKAGGIRISQTKVSRILTLLYNNSAVSIDGDSEIFSVYMECIKGRSFSISDSTFKKSITFSCLDLDSNLWLNNVIFNGAVYFYGCNIKSLSILESRFDKFVDFKNQSSPDCNYEPELQSLRLKDNSFNEGCIFNGSDKELDNLDLTLSPSMFGALTFTNWKVDNTKIQGLNQNLKLSFNHVEFVKLKITNVTNFSNISFLQCVGNESSELVLSNCDLGVTQFNMVRFDSFNSIELNNVVLDKVRATNVTWFREDQLRISDVEIYSLDDFRCRRDVYRQLKQALRMTGNQIDSLEFKARELKAFRAEKKKSLDMSFGDKLIMAVSWTNDYGLNWTKAAGLILVITFLFYLLMIPLFTTELTYSLASTWDEVVSTLEIVWNKKQVFPQLFNPARRFSAVYGANVSDALYFWDVLHRIVLGIFIFQIIHAFRKYVGR
ncbi:MAG: hypothetical protein AAFP76_04445 [Bacteroidota bacterium]